MIYEEGFPQGKEMMVKGSAIEFQLDADINYSYYYYDYYYSKIISGIIISSTNMIISNIVTFNSKIIISFKIYSCYSY
jgi:hypothetical protein